jgi:hypothetical protein
VKVSARGYHHDGGLRTILDDEIIGVVTQEPWPKQLNTLYLQKDRGDGRIRMHIGPKELRFGGNYEVYVEFTENDVAKLFWECFPQIRDVISRLHGLEALAEAHKANELARKDSPLEQLLAGLLGNYEESPNKVDSEIADNVIDLNSRIRSE